MSEPRQEWSVTAFSQFVNMANMAKEMQTTPTPRWFLCQLWDAIRPLALATCSSTWLGFCGQFTTQYSHGLLKGSLHLIMRLIESSKSQNKPWGRVGAGTEGNPWAWHCDTHSERSQSAPSILSCASRCLRPNAIRVPPKKVSQRLIEVKNVPRLCVDWWRFAPN